MLVITGWASTTDVDTANHRVLKDAVELYPYKSAQAGYLLPFVFRHGEKANDVVGSVWNVMRSYDGRRNVEGIWCKGCIRNANAIRLVNNGTVTSLSINLIILNKQIVGGITEIHKAVALEISLALTPINPHCRILSVETVKD